MAHTNLSYPDGARIQSIMNRSAVAQCLAEMPWINTDDIVWWAGKGAVQGFQIIGANGVLHPSVSFTRASTGRTQDTWGVYTTAVANQPRYDYVGGQRGLLIEPAATNLLFPSTNVTGWALLNGSCTKVAAQGGEGGYWVRVTSSTAIGGCYKGFSVPAVALVRHSISMQLRNNGGVASISIGVGQGLWGTGGDRSMAINLSTGVISGSSPDLLAPSLANLGNGTYLLIFGVLPTVPATSVTLFTYGATGADYLWASMQMEVGTRTSAILTTTAAATRAADVPTIATGAFGFNPDEGTFVCEYLSRDVSRSGGAASALFNLPGSASDRMSLFGGAGGLLRFEGAQGGSVQFAIDAGPTVAGVLQKASCSYASNYFAVSENGATAVVDSSGVVTNPVASMTIGAVTMSGQLNGVIFNLGYNPRKFTAAELKAATT